VLTAQPSLDARRIQRKQMKLAMSVGDNRHYRIDEILPRHFYQTSEQAGLSKSLVRKAIDVKKGIRARMRVLQNGLRT
jgi:serine/threonine-protein kinase HipA